MDATDINWEPILEMLPMQEAEDYEERVKYVKCISIYSICSTKEN